MDTYQWSKEMIERLVSLYRSHELLYNTTLPAYNYTKKRDAARRDIFKELKKMDSNISMEDVALKCKDLRGNYVRERRRYLNFKKCEQARDEDYVPKLWYFHQLHFFEPFLQTDPLDGTSEGNDKPVKKKPKIQKAARKSQESKQPQPKVEYKIVQTNNTDNRLHEKPKEIRSREQALTEKVLALSNILASRTSQKYDWLGKQIVFEMNKITSEDLREEATWAIQSILKKTLSEDRLRQQNCRQNYLQITSSTPRAPRTFNSLEEDFSAAHGTIEVLEESIEDLFDEIDEDDC